MSVLAGRVFRGARRWREGVWVCGRSFRARARACDSARARAAKLTQLVENQVIVLVERRNGVPKRERARVVAEFAQRHGPPPRGAVDGAARAAAVLVDDHRHALRGQILNQQVQDEAVARAAKVICVNIVKESSARYGHPHGGHHVRAAGRHHLVVGRGPGRFLHLRPRLEGAAQRVLE